MSANRPTPEERLAEKQKQKAMEERIRQRRAEEAAQRKAAAKELRAKRKDPAWRAEQKANLKSIKQQRKDLRKDLRKQGIKKKSDFELFAAEVGLSLPEGTTEAAFAKLGSRLSAVGGLLSAIVSLRTIMIAAAALLALVFLFAYITEQKGHFTINLTADMMREGFVLSENEDFESTVTRLFADEMVNTNATSIYEMNRNVNEIDGSHNGPGYLAYTFYLRNDGEMTTDYGYTVNILSETLETASAAWVMFFEDDRQIIYAQAQDNGDPEELYGYPDAPFIETAYDGDSQYYTENGAAGIVTTPFIDGETALQGYVENFKPGDVKKYTCVIWLEGDDPDCNNSILGGHVGFNVQFERLGDEETGFFKGLYRTEYETSFYAEDSEAAEETTQREDAHQAETPTASN